MKLKKLTPQQFIIGAVMLVVLLHFPMQFLFDTGNPIFGFETIHELFDLDNERSFGTWMSQALLLFTALGIFLSKAVSNSTKLILVPFLVLLSIDESISLHERLLTYFSEAGISGAGFFSFTWLYVGLPIAVALVAYLAVHFIKVRDLPKLFYIGLVVFLSGAVFFEGLHGLISTSEVVYSTLMVGLEEALEFIGIVMMFTSVSGAIFQSNK